MSIFSVFWQAIGLVSKSKLYEPKYVQFQKLYSSVDCYNFLCHSVSFCVCMNICFYSAELWCNSVSNHWMRSEGLAVPMFGVAMCVSLWKIGHAPPQCCWAWNPWNFISWKKKDSKWGCDTTTPESIHTKDESKRGSAFPFIFGVNWPVQWDVTEWQVLWNSCINLPERQILIDLFH